MSHESEAYSSLTRKQQRFVEEYLVNYNAKEAAVKAGYSPRSAETIGYENLRKPSIQKVLTEKSKVITEKAESEAVEVVKLHHSIAFSRIGCIFDGNGKTIAPKELPDEIQLLIKHSKPHINSITGEVIWEHFFRDQDKAAEALSKYHGLYEKDNKQKEGAIADAIAGRDDAVNYLIINGLATENEINQDT